jgi:hypothetical protein
MGRVKDHFADQIERQAMEAGPQPTQEDYMRKDLSERLHAVLAEAVAQVRQELSDAEIASRFRLDIEASGRLSCGDILVSYKVGESYGSSNAEGGRLDTVLSEYMRRSGWNKRNAPLALPAPGERLLEPVAQDNEPADTGAFMAR